MTTTLSNQNVSTEVLNLNEERIYRIKVRRPEIKMKIGTREIRLELENAPNTEITDVTFKIGKHNIQTIKKIIPIYMETKHKVAIQDKMREKDRPFLPDTKIIKDKEKIKEFFKKIKERANNPRVKPIHDNIIDFEEQTEKIEVYNYLIINKAKAKELSQNIFNIIDTDLIKERREYLTKMLEERPNEKEDITSEIEKLKLIEALYLPIRKKLDAGEEIAQERLYATAELIAKVVETLKYTIYEEIIQFEKIREKVFPYSTILCLWGADVRLYDKDGNIIKLKNGKEVISTRTNFLIDHVALEIITQQVIERLQEIRETRKEELESMEIGNYLLTFKKDKNDLTIIVFNQKDKRTKIFKLENTERDTLMKDIEAFISKNNLENNTYKNYRLEIIDKVLYLALRENKIPIENVNIKKTLVELYQKLL